MVKPIWKYSPNFRETSGREVTCVVVHATATAKSASPLEWLCTPKSMVSAHYVIDTDGAIYQLVNEKDIAWHAGVSEWKGRDGVNSFSIGVELVNTNDYKMPYSKQQCDACLELVRDICARHKIKTEDILAHYDVAPGRKNDPAGFDMPWLRKMVDCKEGPCPT